MDPYLEDADMFPSFHGNLIFSIQELLQPQLPEPYFAKTNERVWVEMTARYVEPEEIDLLRGGEHTTAVPPAWALTKAGPFEYHVCIHRFDNLEDFFVYPIQLPESLPEIAIPLLPGDEDMLLDLQAAMNRAYDAGPYRREIDYAKDKITPLPRPSLAKWAKGIVAARKPARR
jgi:hypothetical protein